ncbi:flagellar hook-associated protein FlgL [Caballeronia sordidicola]|jgi:flagellar hook-associated protein 3 FlgL|uniref:Flagellar hook-associated protein FlgL n=1 Tax=Caballeronia sordidicola TaxID=196367 RepID=A0A226X962_CABSO|nr:flagellar hook-associated protein FlgL [Caballeronia sordidicola]OXC79497.1 Flagellar hook-associated protein FlgL [Caballeronia sordidicola]
MRISSSQYFTMNVETMNNQQASLANMYAQISSGKALQTAADNPLGAAQAVALTSQAANLAQYSTNQSSALTSLQQEDSTLSSVTNVMQSIQSLVVNAGNGTLNDTDRSALATQLQGYRSTLMTLANTTDANGNYIFAGFQGGSKPFSDNASGVGATYDGGPGQRQVQISDTRTINVADPGSAIFQSVSSNESSPVSSGSAANTGSGTIGPVSVSDSSDPANSLIYTITFGTTTTGTPPASVSSYSITSTDPSTTPPTVTAPTTPTPYTAGSNITVGSQTVAISGTPASGDKFSVSPANTGSTSDTDIFTTLDSLVNALKQPADSASAQATLQNALTTAGSKISNTYNNVLTTQTAVGGREQEVTATQTAMQTTSTQTANNLSDLVSVNLPSAISQYEMTQNSLQAAQQAFAQIQKMSLFNYLSS